MKPAMASLRRPLRARLRRLFCSHSSTEKEVESETSPGGVYTTRTVRHVCLRCGKDMA